MEKWDAYDKNFSKLEGLTLTRGETIPDGLYHVVCTVVVQHEDGTYLLMQRDRNKHLGGKWELSAGGSAIQGETPEEGALRETEEETGIKASSITRLGIERNDERHCFYVIYLCITDCRKDSVVLQEGETIDYKWVSPRELESEDLASFNSLSFLKRSEFL